MNIREQAQRLEQLTERELEAFVRLLARYYRQLGLEPALARRTAEVDFATERAARRR
jgi:hypothetical protein